MKCSKCSRKAIGVFQQKGYCSEHFKQAFEDFVFNFMDEKKLISSSRVAVAVSGGKDSTSVLNVVMKYMDKKGLGKPKALSVDEGIKGYRKETIGNVRDFCDKNNIELKVVSYREEFGFSLDEFLEEFNTHPCTVCGILRRYLLNKLARDYDVLVTGHNLDDESQSVLMNLVNADLGLLARQGFRPGLLYSDKFTKRIKPFYLVKEKEVMVYSLVCDLGAPLGSCPNAHLAFRNPVRDLINEREGKEPGVKRNIVEFFLSLKGDLVGMVEDDVLQECGRCGEPTSGNVCKACLIRESWEKGEQLF